MSARAKKVDALKAKLTPLQYKVTQEQGTEPPFENEYWDNKKAGIYVDVVTGEALFSSTDKYDSGSGWPSFTRPIEPEKIATHPDRKLWMERIEIRSKSGDSHLGHVFDDGPGPDRKRYCVNSASLRFVPLEEMEKEGYGEYLPLFGKEADDKKQRRPLRTAVLGAGCFWGVQEIFSRIPGVVRATSGYSGGELVDPDYKAVCTGETGHAEVVRVEYDPSKLSYEELLDTFFRLHDPTTRNRQGPDWGSQYRSVIFYSNEEEKQAALRKIQEVERSGKWKGHVVTELAPAAAFYEAEEYHQDYLKKHPDAHTCHYLR